MNRRLVTLALVANLAAPTIGLAQGQPIKLIGILELSGAGASIGTNYNNGLLLAAKELNAAGGILGRKIEVTTMDSQTNAGVAKGLAQKALDMDAFAVVGPTFSGSIAVSMSETRRGEIPNFTGGAAAHLTQLGNPYLIRTMTNQSASMPKIARFIKTQLNAKVIDVIWINNDMGKGGRDEVNKALTAEGIKIGADVSTEQGQVDFSSAVLKVKQSNGDAVFVYSNEEESARILRELRKQGYAKPIVGDTTLVNQKAIELAGDAANGAIGHVALTADAPEASVRAFDEKFTKEYRYKADHNAIQGYMVPYIIKAVSEKIGKVDSKAFTVALKGMPLYINDTPGLLLNMKFDAKGDADRISYMVKIEGGKQKVLATLPPVNPF